MKKPFDATEIACSLTDDEFRQRLLMVRESLLPHLIDSERLETGLKLTFPDSVEHRTNIETLVELESQCCAFLTFTLEPLTSTPLSTELILTIEGPAQAQPVLDTLSAWVTNQRVADYGDAHVG